MTNDAVKLLVQKSGLPDVQLRESLLLVWGRRFSCDVATGMIPLGDLLNHRFYPSCAWESPTLEAPDVWKLRAKVDMSAGESLNFCYCEDGTRQSFVTGANAWSKCIGIAGISLIISRFQKKTFDSRTIERERE